MIFPIVFNNEKLLDLVFKITLYFIGGDLTTRQGVAQAIRSYVDLVGDRLTWQATQRSRRWVKFKPATLDWLDSYVAKMGEDDDISFRLYEQSGDPAEAPRAAVSTISCRKWEHDLGTYQSYISFSFPFSWFSSPGRPHPRELMRRWAGLVHARHGWSGVGFNCPNGLTGECLSEMAQYNFALIWPNLLLELAYADSRHLIHEMREPGWLTAVGTPFLEKLGGAAALRTQLAATPGVDIVDYEGGILIQAGAEPDPVMLRIFDPAAAWLTDPGVAPPSRPIENHCLPPKRMVAPNDYSEMVAVATALKPVRVASFGYQGRLHTGFDQGQPLPEGRFMDIERTKAWIDRYDVPSPWDRYRVQGENDVEWLRNYPTFDYRRKWR